MPGDLVKDDKYRMIAKTPHYSLFCKSVINQLWIVLKIIGADGRVQKQYRNTFYDYNMPRDIDFFIKSTKKLAQFIADAKNYEINRKNGSIILKIPMTTISERIETMRVTLQLIQSPMVAAKMIETLGDLRSKINKIQSPKVNNIKKSSNERKYKTIKAEKSQVSQNNGSSKQKDQLSQAMQHSLLKLKKQVLEELNENMATRLNEIKKEIKKQMCEYIEQMKHIMKNELRKQIRQQFWETHSAHQQKGQYLFNMLRNPSENQNEKLKQSSLIQKQLQNKVKVQRQNNSQNKQKSHNRQEKNNENQSNAQQSLSKCEGSSFKVYNQEVQYGDSYKEDDDQREEQDFDDYYEVQESQSEQSDLEDDSQDCQGIKIHSKINSLKQLRKNDKKLNKNTDPFEDFEENHKNNITYPKNKKKTAKNNPQQKNKDDIFRQ